MNTPMMWITGKAPSARTPALVLGLLLLAGCATPPQPGGALWEAPGMSPAPAPALRDGSVAQSPQWSATPEPEQEVARRSEVHRGSGAFLREIPPRAEPALRAGDITLNFELADVREVVKAVLGDILGENYVVEPNIQGRVTLQTSRPLAREALLTVLESTLRLNGIAIVHQDGLYRVVPLSAAAGVARPASQRADVPGGFQVRVVPLRYVSAEEMRKILDPVAPQGGIVRVDAARNLLMLAGTGEDMGRMLDTIEIFDVDWLKGMSFGLYPLQRGEPRLVAAELEHIFGAASNSPLAGLVRLVPVERLGALLVVTPQPQYLEAVGVWVERLDRSDGVEGPRLYVYRVQNGRAEQLAEVLRELFVQRDARAAPPAPPLAPGLTPVELETARVLRGLEDPTAPAPLEAVPLERPERREQPPVPRDREGLAEVRQAAEPAVAPVPAAPRANGAEVGALGVGTVGIIAEQANNALVILATPADYERVEAAIRRLDVVPLQVLVEASIVEVTLTGDLAYGIQWFFQNRVGGEGHTGRGTVGAPIAFSPTFQYSIVNAAGELRAILAALAREGKINVISSPSLMVLDNQTANIRVGDQQPIRTAVFGSDGRLVAESVQFKDTGVILDVTPRVNAGGLVRMDIRQEVTDVGQIDEATGQRGFLQRSITSSVAVQSGETVVLGGLIRESKNSTRSGVPGLYRLPVLGPLFGQTIHEAARTELLVMITPRAVQDANEARRVTEELRRKMRSISPEEHGIRLMPPAPTP
jgi:general secretion pathway protein D